MRPNFLMMSCTSAVLFRTPSGRSRMSAFGMLSPCPQRTREADVAGRQFSDIKIPQDSPAGSESAQAAPTLVKYSLVQLGVKSGDGLQEAAHCTHRRKAAADHVAERRAAAKNAI
jgi:hypothetical protein